ncbi:MAG: oligosaccharide flippase family protein [Bacteroidales bacterium]|nr:oligosaccharide flippase family protein [Bacteroidales bacterium]
MFKNLLNTITTRFLTAVINFFIVIIATRVLHADGFGTISLIIVGITSVQMLSGIIGSASLVYMSSRYDLFKLFAISYIWASFSSVIVVIILYMFNLIPAEFAVSILFLSFIRALVEINQSILLGKERIIQFNSISLIQTILIIAPLSFLFFIAGKKEISSYVVSLYIAYVVSFILSLIYIFKDLKFTDFKDLNRIIKEVFTYGIFVQVSNFVQFFNYRLTYFIVDSYLGRATLGIFSLGVQLSESIWIISKSMATVLYARVSNSNDLEFSKKITLRFAKASFIVSLICIVILLLIPENTLKLIFGKDFGGIKNVILFLSLGILSVAVSGMFVHYFSGTGKPYFNTICSVIGLVFTLALGFILVPQLGIAGAALTSTFSYFASFVFSMAIFFNITKTKYGKLFFIKDDFKLIIREIKNLKDKI